MFKQELSDHILTRLNLTYYTYKVTDDKAIINNEILELYRRIQGNFVAKINLNMNEKNIYYSEYEARVFNGDLFSYNNEDLMEKILTQTNA